MDKDKGHAQFEQLYGPLAKGDYQIGDTIQWRGGQGEILWIAAPGETPVSGKHTPLTYIVDAGTGFPELVYASEVQHGW